MFILISLTDYTKLGQQWVCWKLLLPLKRTLTNEKRTKVNLRSPTVVILHLGQNNPCNSMAQVSRAAPNQGQTALRTNCEQQRGLVTHPGEHHLQT